MSTVRNKTWRLLPCVLPRDYLSQTWHCRSSRISTCSSAVVLWCFSCKAKEPYELYHQDRCLKAQFILTGQRMCGIQRDQWLHWSFNRIVVDGWWKKETKVLTAVNSTVFGYAKWCHVRLQFDFNSYINLICCDVLQINYIKLGNKVIINSPFISPTTYMVNALYGHVFALSMMQVVR